MTKKTLEVLDGMGIVVSDIQAMSEFAEKDVLGISSDSGTVKVKVLDREDGEEEIYELIPRFVGRSKSSDVRDFRTR